jgi:hypothetical protein
MNSASLLCGNVSADVYFQVTASEVRLGGAAQAVWPCTFDRITSASADGPNIVLCCKGGLVVKLLASLAPAASLSITARVQLPSDIACVSMNSMAVGALRFITSHHVASHHIASHRITSPVICDSCDHEHIVYFQCTE